MVKISRNEGFRSLWSGLGPTLVLAVPTTVTYFSSYEELRKLMSKHNCFQSSDQYQSSLISLTSGGIARVWAVTLVSPLELIRTKMQSQKMTFQQVHQALKVTVKADGLAGLWKGYFPTIYRDVPFSALYWPCYESVKQWVWCLATWWGWKSKLWIFRMCKAVPELEPRPFLTAFVSGALAGSIASAFTLPMDVIKTRFEVFSLSFHWSHLMPLNFRRQLQLGESEFFQKGSVANQSKSVSTLSVAKEIVKSQGVRGLFTGLAPRLMKVAPACAIMISSYESGKAFFRERNRLHSAH